jgi:hypothetical protein
MSSSNSLIRRIEKLLNLVSLSERQADDPAKIQQYMCLARLELNDFIEAERVGWLRGSGTRC